MIRNIVKTDVQAFKFVNKVLKIRSNLPTKRKPEEKLWNSQTKTKKKKNHVNTSL